MTPEGVIWRREAEDYPARCASDFIRGALLRRGFDPDRAWTIVERFDLLAWEIVHARGLRNREA